MQKCWHIAPTASQSHISKFPDLPPMLVQVLYNRGVSDPQQVYDFLNRRCSEDDPFQMRDMARATDVLLRAAKCHVPIAIYGDFDVDGMTATALLVQTLTGLGTDVQAYIPSRIDEGYGLNLEALRKLYGQGIRLIVTADCGIRSIDEIEQARRGLEFIVTDHHSVGASLPFASAVLNPKRDDCPYPCKDLAGVGVAYKLAQALIREASACKMPVHVEESSLLDLVALGTVADMVSLLNENRFLVQQGLELVNQAHREGIRALIRVARLRPGEVTATAIGFALAPRLNAAGRIADATQSYNLLVTGDPVEADRLARQLDEHNRQRQDMTARTYALAEQIALEQATDAPILFAAAESFNSGIVGLVAGRLTEAYYRPAVVIEKGDETSKGSCRSIHEFNITRALDECRGLLVRHGGHAAAAGFTVRNQDMDELIARLSEIACRELSGKSLAPTLNIDAAVPLSEIDWAALEWVQKLEPCGYANPAPLFIARNVRVVDKRTVGGEGQHLKLTVAEGAQTLDAIAFRLGERMSELKDRVDIVYMLEVNEWQCERHLQLNIQDIRPAG